MSDSDRFELLAAVATVADGQLSLEDAATRVCEIVVPKFADICVLDVVRDGGLRRLATRVSGPGASWLEPQVHGRPLPTADEPGVGTAVRSGAPQLLEAFPDELLRAMAKGEDDLALLRALHMRAGIVIPLSARGRTLGALTLLVTEHSGRSYTQEHLRFVEVLAGRVGLALDNAGLFMELQTMEAQLSVALGGLTEAVTIQNPQGNLIYANQAAADLLGYPTPRELLATPAIDIAARYDSFREDGSPLQLKDLPGRRLLESETPQPLVVRVVDRHTGEQRWRETKSSAVLDSVGRVRMVVNVVTDITAIKREELVQRLLAGASEVLSASLDLRETLQRVADICVPELADWCVLSMPNAHHDLQAVAVAHTDPAKVALARRFAERSPVDLDAVHGTARVFHDGVPQLINGITDEMLVAAATDDEHLGVLRSLSMRAGLAVPMITHGRSVGVLTLVSAESGRSFTQDDVTLASELARQAATAVENARLYTERSRIARMLQESLLPDELPAMPGWRTASLYLPAGDDQRVGGDFYEVFALTDDAFMLVVGDVTGRGATAAALTAMMRHTLRAVATDRGSAIHALEKLNRDLNARSQTSLCTAVCVVLRDRAHSTRADIICAGHPLPVLVRQGSAAYVGEFGPILGAFPVQRFEPLTLALEPGDVLVLYSDGVLDAVGPEDRFGPDRLQATLASATGAADAVARIEHALGRFQVGARHDDTAVLAVERTAAKSRPDQNDRSADHDRAARNERTGPR